MVWWIKSVNLWEKYESWCLGATQDLLNESDPKGSTEVYKERIWSSVPIKRWIHANKQVTLLLKI